MFTLCILIKYACIELFTFGSFGRVSFFGIISNYKLVSDKMLLTIRCSHVTYSKVEIIR